MCVIAIIGQAVYDKDPLFWGNVIEHENGCIIPLTKHGTSNGYRMTKRKGRSMMSHRYAYALYYGAEPVNLGCHSCDNPPCINPLHIEDGTHAKNMQDAARRGRKCPGGMTVARVLALRKLYATGGYTMRQLMVMFELKSSATVSNIINRKKWAHV